MALLIPMIWLFIAGSRPVSLWFNSGMSDSTNIYLEGSPFDRNIFTALILAALIVLASRGRKVGMLLRANAPLVLFLCYCGLSIFWSDFPDAGFKRWIRVLGDTVMVMVVLTDPVPAAAIKEFLGKVGFILIPLSVAFDFWRSLSGREYHFGLTTNKNMFGAISMILGLAAVWQVVTIWQSEETKGRFRRLMIPGAIALMSVWCIWTANSTTSTGCFALGTMLIVLLKVSSLARKPAVLHCIIAGVVFLAVYAVILNPDVGVVSSLGKDPTLTGRTDVWKAVIALNPSPWFGAGFESFWLGPRLTTLWSIFVWLPNEAHNGYIEVYLNLGWAGLIMLGLVILTGYRRVINGLRIDRSSGILMLTYFVVAIVYNLTEAGFRIFNPVWILFLLSATVVLKAQGGPAKTTRVPEVLSGNPGASRGWATPATAGRS
jgi:O-antigen ligase